MYYKECGSKEGQLVVFFHGGFTTHESFLTCEQVSGGHPDKICDQVADAIVTDCLVHDKESRVAIKCL